MRDEVRSFAAGVEHHRDAAQQADGAHPTPRVEEREGGDQRAGEDGRARREALRNALRAPPLERGQRGLLDGRRAAGLRERIRRGDDALWRSEQRAEEHPSERDEVVDKIQQVHVVLNPLRVRHEEGGDEVAEDPGHLEGEEEYPREERRGRRRRLVHRARRGRLPRRGRLGLRPRPRHHAGAHRAHVLRRRVALRVHQRVGVVSRPQHRRRDAAHQRAAELREPADPEDLRTPAVVGRGRDDVAERERSVAAQRDGERPLMAEARNTKVSYRRAARRREVQHGEREAPQNVLIVLPFARRPDLGRREILHRLERCEREKERYLEHNVVRQVVPRSLHVRVEVRKRSLCIARHRSTITRK